MVGCEVGANTIRLHDEVVGTLANLPFKSIHIDPIIVRELLRLFDSDSDSDDHRRPAFPIRKPRGF